MDVKSKPVPNAGKYGFIGKVDSLFNPLEKRRCGSQFPCI